MVAVRQVGENFSRFLANRAGLYAHTRISVTLTTVEQVGWEDFEARAGGPGLVAAFMMGEGQVYLYVPAALGLALVDLHLAGPGTGASRQMSETERQLVSPFVSGIASSLADAASSVFGETAAGPVSQVGGVSGLFLSNRRMPCIYLAAEVHVPSSQRPVGEIGACMPISTLRPLLARLQGTAGSNGASAAAARAVLEVPVTLTFRFPSVRVPLDMARDLAPGQVLAIGHLLGQPLALHVGGKEMFKAVMAEHGKRAACEIVEATDDKGGTLP
jgi:flagellar motor switch protein FliM